MEHCAPEPDRSFVLSQPDGDVVLSLTMDGPVLGKDGQNILPILDLTVGDQAQQPIGDDYLGPWLHAHAVEQVRNFKARFGRNPLRLRHGLLFIS